MPNYPNLPSLPHSTYEPITQDQAFAQNRYASGSDRYSTFENRMLYIPQQSSRMNSVSSARPSQLDHSGYETIELDDLNPLVTRHSLNQNGHHPSTQSLVTTHLDLSPSRRMSEPLSCSHTCSFVGSRLGSIGIGTLAGTLAPLAVVLLPLAACIACCSILDGGDPCDDMGKLERLSLTDMLSNSRSQKPDHAVFTVALISTMVGQGVGGGMAHYALTSLIKDQAVLDKSAYIYAGGIIVGGIALGITLGLFAATVRSCHKQE